MTLSRGARLLGVLARPTPTRLPLPSIQARSLLTDESWSGLGPKKPFFRADANARRQANRPAPYRDQRVDPRFWSGKRSKARNFIYPRPDEFEGTEFLKAAVDASKVPIVGAEIAAATAAQGSSPTAPGAATATRGAAAGTTEAREQPSGFFAPVASRARSGPIPDRLPICPDVPTFLTLIGRKLNTFVDKFGSWESFWSLSPEDLEPLIPQAHTRRYLIDWMRRYRNGEYGPAWNLKYIDDGRCAVLAVYRYPDRKGPGSRVVVNVPPGKTGHTITPEEVHVMGYPYSVKRNKQPCGPHARAWKRNKAMIDNWDGIWEIKQGVKVNGGERRRKEVLFHKRVALRKELREAAASF
jgi:hypothetical protein